MIKSNAKVLLVENDTETASQISMQLGKNGIEVISVKDGGTALEQFEIVQPSVVVSELYLEDMDGLQLCRTIRNVSSVPFILMSEKADVFDIVLGLEMGADDYISKPFDPRELVARIKVAVRHMRLYASTEIKEKVTEEKKLIQLPGLMIDVSTYTVELDGEKVSMPPKELQVLHMLAEQPNKVFTRDQLLERIWGYDFFGNSRTVDVHVKRIREKLTNGKEHIWKVETVWGVGYKFVLPEDGISE